MLGINTNTYTFPTEVVRLVIQTFVLSLNARHVTRTKPSV